MTVSQTLKRVLIGPGDFWPKSVAQRRYPRPLPNSLEGLSLPSVSIVIPTRNRPVELKKCVNSILQQTVLPKEVLVVDDGNLPPHELDKWFSGTGIPVKHVRKEIPGTAASRNVGAHLASGEILSFVDDDIVLAPRYTEELLRVFLSDPEKKVAGVVGRIKNLSPSSNLSGLAHSFFGLYLKRHEGWMGPTGMRLHPAQPDYPMHINISGGIIACRKGVFDRFKYDEVNFPSYTVSEDTEFTYRVSQAFEIVYTPFASFDHLCANGGRPHPFKQGVQGIYGIILPRLRSGPWGMLHVPALAWFTAGTCAFEFLRLAKATKTRRIHLWHMLGRATGIATWFLADASTIPLSVAWKKWLSKIPPPPCPNDPQQL